MEEIKKAFDQKYMTKEMFFVSPSNNFIKENAIEILTHVSSE